MEKIKIMHLIGDLTKGGAERFVVDLCNELAKDDQYEVYLVSICVNDTEDTFVKDVHKNVRYVSFNKGRGFSLRAFLALTKWLSREEPDVLHSHLNGFEYLALYLLANKRTLFFHTIHNIAVAECPVYFLKVFRKLWYKINRVKPVTISFDGRKTYRDYYQLDNDILIENGREDLVTTSEYTLLSEHYREGEDTFTLVHIGRIVSEKNQELLIRAVQKFNITEDKKCKLVIIGEVKEKRLYQHLLELVNNDPYIEFVGGRHNVVDYLTIADAFCLSSIFEGMPISLIEALSVGCIPICTPVGGIGQMIRHGKTGFLSKDVSLESYYDVLKEALYHPDKKMIKLNGRLFFKLNYHIQASANAHLKTYSAMLTSGKSNMIKGYEMITKI
nr:glycosyltransferase [Pedobacter panaciterrae]